MTNAWANLRWGIACWISRSLTAFGGVVPTQVWYVLAVPVVEVCFLVMRPQRRRLIENLRRVVGKEEAEATARRVFHAYARYVIDFYQLPQLGRGAVEKRVVYDKWPRLHAALNDGNGTVFVTLHLGHAELGAAAVANSGHQVNVIAETFSYAPMDEFIQGLRRKLGMTIITANKASPGLLRCLKRGEVLAMLFDAVRAGEGMRVRFFGAEAEMSSAPARIALRAGARVLTTVVARDPDDPMKLVPYVDFEVGFEPTGDEEADVKALTQAMASSFEEFVRRFPEQWFAFRPVWVDTSPLPSPGQTRPSTELRTGKRANGQNAPLPLHTPQTGRRAEGQGTDEESKDGGEAWKLKALQAAFLLGRILPRSAAYGIARLGGDLAYRYRHGAREDVEDNMRHVLDKGASPETVSRYAREAFRNVARYYVDLIRLPQVSRQDLTQKHVRLHDFDRLTSTLESGRGAIVATAHYGNPEMAVQIGAMLGIDVLVLAEPLQPPAFASLMHQIRSTFGPRYVDVGYGAIAEALRHLRAGGCLAIAAERDIQGKGAPMEFFGEVTRVPLGAVELAARTGAAVIPCYCHRSGDGFDLYFEEPLILVNTGQPKADAMTNTRALLMRIEEWIRADPGQWMVLDRIWKPTAAPVESSSTPAK